MLTIWGVAAAFAFVLVCLYLFRKLLGPVIVVAGGGVLLVIALVFLSSGSVALPFSLPSAVEDWLGLLQRWTSIFLGIFEG